MLIGVQKADDGLPRKPVAGAIDQFSREMIDAQPDGKLGPSSTGRILL